MEGRTKKSVKKRFRCIQDNIHRYIHFDEEYWKYIDNPQFQRLREIKQLGMTYFVYPGGVHTRFEHSLGTANFAGETMDILNMFNSDEIEYGDRENVIVAGLILNLGNGPFSHIFNKTFIRKTLGIKDWSYRKASKMLFEYMIDQNHIDIEIDNLEKKKYTTGLMENILSLINKWLYSIVSNKRNSIDADKFDYILRDAYNVGIKNIFFDVKRLINSSRIVNDDLAFHHKNQSNLYGLFLSRYKLYKEVYRDRTCTAIDFMMNDMLLQAHPYFKFDEIINNPKNYSKLTDNYVLTKIENNDDEGLISANKILDKIKGRELYKFVAELLLNPLNFALQLEKINVQDIINGQKGDGSLQQKDIRLSIFDIDFGLEEKNPVQNVIFYTDKNLRKAKEDKNFSAFYIEEDQFGLLTPSLFKETCVRIYVTDEIKLDDAREAFIIYGNKVFGLTPNY